MYGIDFDAKTVLPNITTRQARMMRHALGLDLAMGPKTGGHDLTLDRNSRDVCRSEYVACQSELADWDDLAKGGLAECVSRSAVGLSCFRLTEAGIIAGRRTA